LRKNFCPENRGGRRTSALGAAGFLQPFKPFAALDFRAARGDFGARLAGPIGALAAGCQEDIAWRTIRYTI
jgi:hypothetical protein